MAEQDSEVEKACAVVGVCKLAISGINARYPRQALSSTEHGDKFMQDFFVYDNDT